MSHFHECSKCSESYECVCLIGECPHPYLCKAHLVEDILKEAKAKVECECGRTVVPEELQFCSVSGCDAKGCEECGNLSCCRNCSHMLCEKHQYYCQCCEEPVCDKCRSRHGT